MARHRKRPVSRHRAHGHGGGPAAPGAPGAHDRSLGSAIRRVVVTPTFAAGLGVVVAAVMAYPMQTVFSYVAPYAGGQGSLRCTQGGCAHQSGPAGKPSPFGGAIRNPARAKPADRDHHRARASAGHPGDPGGQPRLSYKIISRWPGGFWEQITISFTGPVPANWRLRFGYATGRIFDMNPAGHRQPGGHGAVVRSTDYYSGGWGPSGRTIQIGVGVQGGPAAPARCTFDGRPCRIG